MTKKPIDVPADGTAAVKETIPETTPETTPVSTPEKKPPVNASGFYCYIGPNLKGLIRNGNMFRGDKAAAFTAAKEAFEKYPEAKALLVPGDALPSARLRVKQPGNALYVSYQKLAGK